MPVFSLLICVAISSMTAGQEETKWKQACFSKKWQRRFAELANTIVHACVSTAVSALIRNEHTHQNHTINECAKWSSLG
jgi:negative regulator of sigma E activity